MPRKIPDFDTVLDLARDLPGIEAGMTFGATSLKLHGRLLACPAMNKSAEPDTLMVRISFDQRDALILSDPEVFYLTDHYVNYPCVLVRLARIRRDGLRALLVMAWEFADSRKKTEKRAITRTKRSR
jgi:hypothetical protein